MDPYRGVPDRAEAEAPRDRGIVGDVIDQFADPMAFYRELIQNAIDADTPSIDVSVVHDAAARTVRATVKDAGVGMTRDILEHQLLVLFRSTKEGDDTKIGKFGIGFASVLSPRPNLVVVTTVRDGRRLALHLYPDLHFEIFDGGPAQRTGTSVELELPIQPDDVAGFARRSLDALVRWCRHAAVPIRFTAPTCGAGLDDVRVDRPLGLDEAVVSVQGKTADGKTIGVVGVLAAAAPYAGFFDHGLTLHETHEPVPGRLALRRLAFKVQDSRLGHTISRDNVLRDGAYDRAVDFVHDLAERELPRMVAAVVREAAGAGDRARYTTLMTTLFDAGMVPDRDAWAVPLLEPLGERRWVTAGELGRRAWGAWSRSPLTAAIAAAGEPVVDLCGRPDDRWLVAALERHAGRELTAVATELTRVAPIVPSLPDQTLLSALRELLDHAHRAPSSIVLAEIDGALGAEPTITGGHDDAELQHPTEAAWVIGVERARRSPFERLRKPPLVLNVHHAQIAAARRRAVDDPAAAASLLARALLLRYGALDHERSEQLLVHTLTLTAAGPR